MNDLDQVDVDEDGSADRARPTSELQGHLGVLLAFIGVGVVLASLVVNTGDIPPTVAGPATALLAGGLMLIAAYRRRVERDDRR